MEGARPRHRGAHTRSQVHGLAGTHRQHAGVLGLGSEEHADPFAGRLCPGEPEARGHRGVRGGSGLGRNHSGDMGMRGQGSSTSVT